MRCKILFALVIFATAQYATAQTLEGSTKTVNYVDLLIDESGVVNVNYDLEIRSADGDRFWIPVPSDADKISVSDASGSVQYKLVQSNETSLLEFYPKPAGKIAIAFKTQGLTSKFAGVWRLSTSLDVTPQKTIVRIKFPDNSNTKVMNITPHDVLMTPVKDGLWLYPQTTENGSFTFSIDYTIGEIPVSRAVSGYVVPLLIVLLVLLSLFILFSKRRAKGKEGEKTEPETVKPKPEEVKEAVIEPAETPEEVKKTDEEKPKSKKVKEPVLNVLEDREKEIVELLAENPDEEITQAYIYKTTKIPKATLSDLIKNLEARNIIDKRKDGRLVWIKLKEDVLG